MWDLLVLGVGLVGVLFGWVGLGFEFWVCVCLDCCVWGLGLSVGCVWFVCILGICDLMFWICWWLAVLLFVL